MHGRYRMTINIIFIKLRHEKYYINTTKYNVENNSYSFGALVHCLKIGFLQQQNWSGFLDFSLHFGPQFKVYDSIVPQITRGPSIYGISGAKIFCIVWHQIRAGRPTHVIRMKWFLINTMHQEIWLDFVWLWIIRFPDSKMFSGKLNALNIRETVLINSGLGKITPSYNCFYHYII